jgi:hypothetical protein
MEIVGGETVTVPHAELVNEPCIIEQGLPTNITPCLVVMNKSVTVWLFHNGFMKG